LEAWGLWLWVLFDPTPTKNYYCSGILLLAMGAFTFVLVVTVCSFMALTTILAYEAVAIFANHTDTTILIKTPSA
jgi:hypothetical protein